MLSAKNGINYQHCDRTVSFLLNPSSLRDLKDVKLAGIFERLPPITEPDPHNFPVIVQLLSDLSDFLASGEGILLEVGIEDLNGLRGEGGPTLAFL